MKSESIMEWCKNYLDNATEEEIKTLHDNFPKLFPFYDEWEKNFQEGLRKVLVKFNNSTLDKNIKI